MTEETQKECNCSCNCSCCGQDCIKKIASVIRSLADVLDKAK